MIFSKSWNTLLIRPIYFHAKSHDTFSGILVSNYCLKTDDWLNNLIKSSLKMLGLEMPGIVNKLSMLSHDRQAKKIPFPGFYAWGWPRFNFNLTLDLCSWQTKLKASTRFNITFIRATRRRVPWKWRKICRNHLQMILVIICKLKN